MRADRFTPSGVAAGLLLALAACTTGTVATTTMTSTPTVTTTPPATTTTLDPALGLALPVDPDVRQGRLDNGLTYYLRYNDSPGGRLELRLLVDVGSVQEDDDQSGNAHFLEHMMFNGTEKFPRNDLVAVLESFGPRFGPDINASTSFDESVYELSLDASDEDLVDLGVEVLREWAGRATLAEPDVILERGVVLDEWRLRVLGFSGRLSEAFQGLVLPGTVYEGRLPIGDDDAIRSTTPEQLRRFYDDWYRPDLMAVVAVGDVDLDEMEARLVEGFADLQGPGSPRQWDPITYEPPTQARTLGFTDEEAASASVTVVWPLAAKPAETIGDFQSAVALSLAIDMVSNRLNDDALRGTSLLLGATGLDFEYTRAIELAGFDVESRPADLDQALDTLLVEVLRVNEFGFTDFEVERALTEFAAVSEQVHEQQATLQDAQITAQIVTHYLEGGHLMSPSQRFEVESDILARLTKTDIARAFAALTETAPIVLAVGPDDQVAVIPDGDRILEILSEVASRPVTAREDDDTTVGSLMAAPDAVFPTKVKTDAQFGFTTLEFKNGAEVFLWVSGIAEEGVFVLAESFGGTSQIEIEDLPEAFLVTDIIGRSGVGPADVPTLQRLLADRLVEAFPWISETREGITGGSASKDVEVLFQLIHLYMTAPRFDEVAVTAVLDEMKTLNASRADLPGVLLDEALNQSYYGDDPRYFVLPTDEQLAEFDVAAAERVYRERFANAGDFAFAFVGDFDVTEMTNLASRYIGTLPGTPEREGFVDNQPLPARRVQLTTVEAGSDPQGRVSMYFTNEFEPELKDRITARLVELILNARLRERIREELSATYVVFAGIDLQRDPDPFAESFVTVTGDPNDLARISDEVLTEILDLQSNGPTAQQFATGIEQLRDELNLIGNPTIADAIITSYLYPDQPVIELFQGYALIDQLTISDVQNLAGIAFNPGQRIEVRLVPRP